MKEGIISFIGGGDLYMDLLAADGSSRGLEKVGNATKFAIKVDSETKKLLARGRDNYGQTLASTTRISATTISISLNQIDHNTLAAVFMGDSAKRTGAGGTITDEAITARLGRWVELAHGDISAVTVTNASGSVTYVAGTDYNVNARLGLIQAITGGAIADAAALLVDYTWAAETGYRITGATKPVVKVSLRLDGKNDYNGEPVVVRVWEANLQPASEVDFLAEDFAEMQFEGELISPLGKSWPFEVV